MKPPNWHRIQEIFAEAQALSPAERAFLTIACAGDLDLERQVDELLEAQDSLGDFLESPIVRLNPMAEELEGRTIDERYLVERELGHTAMSQVYLARALRLHRQPVVIKILSAALFEDADARRRFDSELKTLLSLNHPNVVRVQDSGQLDDGRPYLVMPYIQGEMLRSQIPSEGMDLERAASILKQIGAALDHVHENGILHRDLKPENIMLERGSDSVVLIDFGIARISDSVIASSTSAGSFAGTLAYMSPQQLNGERITAASDIYSMGVIAYEMVTGRRPFNPTSPSNLRELQRAGVRARPGYLREGLSAKADRAIIRALSFEPKARYKTAGEFADRLAQALQKEPTGPKLPIKVPTWVRFPVSLAILALLSFGIYEYCKNGPPSRSFEYWLTIHRMRDGKEYQDPFQSHGEGTFENGDKFRLSVSSPSPGYLYVLNEGPPDTTDTSFLLIYPNNATNSGSARVGANQPIQSDWVVFRGPAGDENFWIVWSVNPVRELESAKAAALQHPRGGLTGESLVTVREFLRLKQAEFKTTVYHYKAKQTAVARGTTDTLMTLAQFKHR